MDQIQQEVNDERKLKIAARNRRWRENNVKHIKEYNKQLYEKKKQAKAAAQERLKQLETEVAYNRAVQFIHNYTGDIKYLPFEIMSRFNIKKSLWKYIIARIDDCPLSEY